MTDVYGLCPLCGVPGMSRERRLNGNDTCANRHVYPSAMAVKEKPAKRPKLTPPPDVIFAFVNKFGSPVACRAASEDFTDDFHDEMRNDEDEPIELRYIRADVVRRVLDVAEMCMRGGGPISRDEAAEELAELRKVIDESGPWKPGVGGLTSLCSVCDEPQFASPGGQTCPNGHGGAPAKEEP